MIHQGDIVYLDFDPQAGHEQKGRRPALVISNKLFNTFCNLAMVCPITNTNKDHPFHVRLEEPLKTKGVILCDQARILDITARNASFIERAPSNVTAFVVDLVIGFVEILK